MFEDYSQYSKEKVNLFLRYLAYAAFRQVKKENRQQIVGNEEVKTVFTKKELLEQGNFKQRIEDRLMKLNVDRRTELEDKISIHYSNNKFVPYENKLKKLKSRYANAKKKKSYPKDRLHRLKDKITKCDLLIKKLKKSS
ncbi:hypothetical protein HN789_02800 [archaeon]|jgi:hypothetical protein|nr:hypothetical protein [archaeon]MBT4021987.1 hypothetical protein [archaeon]MBT4272303.1 hypothetical protein [archaeon]MBT4460839.1 hypothetical protein [archaeon]MBT5424183.1 hypothetical protein [archaeon]